MAASASDYLENKIADLFFGGTSYTPPATYYLALFSAAPNEAGAGGTEITGGGYARLAITNNKTNFSAASGGVVTNALDLEFAASSGAYSAGITHAVLMDASTSGNMISGAIDLPATITINAANQVVRFRATQLSFTIS
jgi:hypothetical protein